MPRAGFTLRQRGRIHCARAVRGAEDSSPRPRPYHGWGYLVPTIPTDFRLWGPIASRPAAGIAGRSYWVTDDGLQRETLDTGSTWIDMYVASAWAPGSGGGGGGGWTLIDDQIISADTGDVSFSGDWSAYTHLLLVSRGLSDYGSEDQYYLRVNSDSGGIYWGTIDVGGLGIGYGNCQGGNASGNAVACLSWMPWFNDTARPFVILSIDGMTGSDGPTVADVVAGGTSGSMAPVTQLDILVNNGSNWLPGSRFTLYGM